MNDEIVVSALRLLDEVSTSKLADLPAWLRSSHNHKQYITAPTRPISMSHP